MTRWRYPLLACALVLVGVVGYVYGRASAPVVEVERKAKDSARAEAKIDAVSAASAKTTTAATDKGQSVTHRRTTRAAATPPPPGCPPSFEEIVEFIVDNRNQSSTGTSNSSRTDAVKSEAKLATQSEVFEAVKVSERDRDRWLLGAMGRVDLQGNVSYGPVVGVIVGPVQVQAAADVKEKALQVQAVWTF